MENIKFKAEQEKRPVVFHQNNLFTMTGKFLELFMAEKMTLCQF